MENFQIRGTRIRAKESRFKAIERKSLWSHYRVKCADSEVISFRHPSEIRYFHRLLLLNLVLVKNWKWSLPFIYQGPVKKDICNFYDKICSIHFLNSSKYLWYFLPYENLLLSLRKDICNFKCDFINRHNTIDGNSSFL